MIKIALYAALLATSCGLTFGQATEKVLWNFGGPNDGTNPAGSLVFDHSGNLYGTTTAGGNQYSAGTMFRLSPQSGGVWTESVLYNFCSDLGLDDCIDGQEPGAGLTFDRAGNLYGTTELGGKTCWAFYGTCGTVFKLARPQSPATTWTETVLYAFCVSYDFCTDGLTPTSQVVFDAAGNLYGTTLWGGGSVQGGNLGIAAGDVFELTPGSGGWTETVLYSFNQYEGDPQGGVIFDAFGNLYGATRLGPNMAGFVYEVSPSSAGWTGQTLGKFAFDAGSTSPLATDNNGNFYGTSYDIFGPGNSTVFGFNVVTRTSQLHNFSSAAGSGALSGVLIDARRKSLLGTAYAGGANNGGTVWEVGPGGEPVAVYSFCTQPNCADGEAPNGALIQDQAGNLYGVTNAGGTYNQGVVFEITP
ncbi:MAG: choice-of-anchor tandem repeat GloVer-containing protein [Terriglobales bacterium]